MSKGWISIHRKIWDSKVWNSREPFDSRSAWLDLLLLASHKDSECVIGKTVENVERGCLITSELKLAERWKWSRTKTRKYLKMLEDLHQIEQQKNRKRTAIKIVNYGIYQENETTNNTTNNITSDTTSDTTDDTYSINIIPKNKSNNDFFVVILERWNKLPDPVPKVSSLVPGSARDKALRFRIADHGVDDVLRAIENISKSTFLCGGGSNGWVVNFDWFLRQENFQKVLDGNYTDKQEAPSTAIYTGEITEEMRKRYGNKSWG